MNNEHFTISEMKEMQKALQEKYKDKWEPICAEIGQNKLLWMIGEIGEVIDIVKKNGGERACTDPEIRQDLIEEMADVGVDVVFLPHTEGISSSIIREKRDFQK